MGKKKPFNAADYPGVFTYRPEDMPTSFTGEAEKEANLHDFSEFFFEHRVNKDTGKKVPFFDIIVRFNKEKNPTPAYWPKASTASTLRRKLEARLKEKHDREESEGKIVVRPHSYITEKQTKLKGKKLDHTTKTYVDAKIARRNNLSMRTNTLAERLAESAEYELDEALNEDDVGIALQRKKHAISVFQHLSRHVHKSKELDIKAGQARVGEATFLMELMGRAAAGKLDAEQMYQLEASIPLDEREELRVSSDE